MQMIKNPVKTCDKVYSLIQNLTLQIRQRMEDPKSAGRHDVNNCACFKQIHFNPAYSQSVIFINKTHLKTTAVGQSAVQNLSIYQNTEVNLEYSNRQYTTIMPLRLLMTICNSKQISFKKRLKISVCWCSFYIEWQIVPKLWSSHWEGTISFRFQACPWISQLKTTSWSKFPGGITVKQKEIRDTLYCQKYWVAPF